MTIVETIIDKMSKPIYSGSDKTMFYQEFAELLKQLAKKQEGKTAKSLAKTLVEGLKLNSERALNKGTDMLLRDLLDDEGAR